MDWKRVHAVLNGFVFLLVVSIIFRFLTFEPPSGTNYQLEPSLVVVAIWLLSSTGFGWSSLGLWLNRPSREVELATIFGIVGQSASFALGLFTLFGEWMRIGFVPPYYVMDLFITVSYLAVLSVNFHFITSNNTYVKTYSKIPQYFINAIHHVLGRVAQPISNMRAKRDPKPFHIHAGLWIGESLATLLLLGVVIYVVTHLNTYILRNLFWRPDSYIVMFSGISIVILLLLGFLGQIFILFRRIKMVSEDASQLNKVP